jgi:hypothetical protein
MMLKKRLVDTVKNGNFNNDVNLEMVLKYQIIEENKNIS